MQLLKLLKLLRYKKGETTKAGPWGLTSLDGILWDKGGHKKESFKFNVRCSVLEGAKFWLHGPFCEVHIATGCIRV